MQDLEEDPEYRAQVNIFKADAPKPSEEEAEGQDIAKKLEETKLDEKDGNESWEDVEEDVPYINDSEIQQS